MSLLLTVRCNSNFYIRKGIEVYYNCIGYWVNSRDFPSLFQYKKFLYLPCFQRDNIVIDCCPFTVRISMGYFFRLKFWFYFNLLFWTIGSLILIKHFFIITIIAYFKRTVTKDPIIKTMWYWDVIQKMLDQIFYKKYITRDTRVK